MDEHNKFAYNCIKHVENEERKKNTEKCKQNILIVIKIDNSQWNGIESSL